MTSNKPVKMVIRTVAEHVHLDTYCDTSNEAPTALRNAQPVECFQPTAPLRYNTAMPHPSAYIPLDRRRALASNQSLPDYTHGAALFADIAGFTSLTAALTRQYGPRRGADELTRQLNRVFTALITEVHGYGGSVIGFSGDAITCWFDADEQVESRGVESRGVEVAALRATAAAIAIQQTIVRFANIEIAPTENVLLTIKTAVAAGSVRRFTVGDPAMCLMDVLAGSLMDRVAVAEQISAEEQGALVLDPVAAALLHDVLTISKERLDEGADQVFTVVASLDTAIDHLFTSQPESSATPQSVQDWLLPQVYDRVSSQYGGRFLAELRPATALFVKFSGIDYDTDTAAGDKLDAYIRWVQGVLMRYEGSLIQLTTGDKGSYLYAAFGAPVAHDDDNERAAAAALDLCVIPAHLAFIDNTQIGLAQGLMRVGPYGSETRRTYAVLGDATNLAARLMNRATPSQILLAENMVASLSEQFDLEFLGFATLKGRQDPQMIHAMIGRQPQSTSHYTALYADPLVGRDPELAQIGQIMTGVTSDGAGYILRIEGSAGVGKSHLAAVVTQQAQAHGLQIIIGACQSTSRDIAYYPIRQMARYMFGLSNRALATSEEEQQTQIAYLQKVIEEMNSDWLLRLPLLGDLLGLPIPNNATTAAFDAQLRREALTALAIEILQTAARQQPMLLLVEDAHWMDEASQSIALALGRVIADAPLLIVAVQRPPTSEVAEFFTALDELPRQTHIALNELRPEGTAALVSNRLHGSVVPLATELIHARAQGNPFFTEELVDALQESGRLIPQDGTWQLSDSLFSALQGAGGVVRAGDTWTLNPHANLSAIDLGIPDTVHGIVLSRLDRLPEPVKLTLKVASVIGRIFEFDLLASAYPVAAERDTLFQHIEVLAARDFARVETPEPNPSYIFKHNITQEAVYRTLVEVQQQDLHWSVAQVLEQLQPEAVERLAHHFYNSNLARDDVRERACHYLDAAGRRAQREYANETALTYFDHALALEERWEWLKAKVEVLHILGRREEENRALEKAQSLALNGPELAQLQSYYYESIGNYEAAEDAIRAVLDMPAEATVDKKSALNAKIRLADLSLRQGNYHLAKQSYESVLGLIDGRTNYMDAEATVRYGIGIVERDLGNHSGAEEHLELCLKLNIELNDRQAQAKALNAIGFISFNQKIFRSAEQQYREALQIYNEIGNRAGEGASLLNLAQVYMSEGEYDRAGDHLRRSLIIHQAINDAWWEAIVWNEMGILQMLIGNWSVAQTNLEHGLRLCDTIGTELMRGYFLCNLGQVRLELQAYDMAQSIFQQGLSIAKDQGDKHLEALYLDDLGNLELARKNYGQAIEYSHRALHLLQEMKSYALHNRSAFKTRYFTSENQ